MNRHDFVFIFDVKDANPNGDPDAGNLPRVDPETGHGLITDVCLKRKVRNYVAMTRGNTPPHEIYFSDGAVLNKTHERAYVDAGLKPEAKKLPTNVAKAREITAFMCRNFYDIRTFGAVMSTDVNCGQVRGPVQFAFSRSVDPVVTSEHAITRSSVTNEKDAAKERTMGRKFTVPYGCYRMHGFVNPFLAEQCGFAANDLDLLWEALANAFQFDQSAARPAGSMSARRLIVFEHSSELGNAPSHKLFDAVTVSRRNLDVAPRVFGDYAVTLEPGTIPAGVMVHEKIAP
jgi:CRISPR-associated protein Csd2